jgi:hypothetical protein
MEPRWVYYVRKTVSRDQRGERWRERKGGRGGKEKGERQRVKS